MMRKGVFAFCIALLCAFMLMGCSTVGAGSNGVQNTEQTATVQATIAEAVDLIGKADDEIAGAVSIWITDGEQEVSDALVQSWQNCVTEFTGAEMWD